MNRQLGSSLRVCATVTATLILALLGPRLAEAQPRAPRPGAAKASTPKDPREMQAREAYAAGRYKDALDVYVKLYAESLHPTYLRNIGRCYQNLEDPDKAIGAFREYLRKSKGLAADEREEIDGYVKEMEALKAKQEAKPAATPSYPEPKPEAGAPPEKPAPPPPAPTLTAPPPAQAQPDLSRPAASEATPMYQKPWFWVVAGVVVAAAVVGGLAAAGVFKPSDPVCPQGRVCEGN